MDDITIMDLDLTRTTWSRVHSSMRTLHLKLSAEPDLDWIRLFREERESRVVVKRYGLWIEDGCLVFDCLLDDVETHHLPDFRKSIDYANRGYRELKAARVQASAQRGDAERDEQARLAALRARVRGADATPVFATTAPAAPAATPAASLEQDAVFVARRDELRARLRAALQARIRELERANG